MTKINYQGKSYPCREGETVLQTFMRNCVTVPFSCGNGICHVCLQRCENGEVPEEAQKGLRDTLKEQGYFLPCKCLPVSDMKIEPPRQADLYNRAVIYKKEFLAPDVCRLLIEPATQLYYHAGQFINLRNENDDIRSYSLASVPQEDYFLEIHVKRVPGGKMSNWIFDELQENDEVEIQGATGNSYYVSGKQEQPILLIGSGTGLSPLVGIARDALLSGHSGPIFLYHGSRTSQGLYLQDELRQLAEKYENFYPDFCVSGENVPEGYQAGRANDVALTNHDNLKGWRVYLCGQPEMVKNTRNAVLNAGTNENDVITDPFWEMGDAVEKARSKMTERRNYPDPDPELWEGLDEGRLLSKVLVDFYTRVYEDPLLSPYFTGVTKQRLIEKQYNFLCQVLTGQDVYFGERPRNAHHWMVISDELFDYRADLMKSCLRRAGVEEHLVRRFHALEEIYRQDIVKDKAWNKILFGKEVPVEGFETMIIDDATLCDSCEQEIQGGSKVQYHIRMGKVFCASCQQE
ncbi:MAG: FAD-binding oxidoreductase [Gammaproteobacteria bacterium]|jgi:NAD(P)H-flavin reductase/truncated hemoglobin YjbI/ferredoxin